MKMKLSKWKTRILISQIQEGKNKLLLTMLDLKGIMLLINEISQTGKDAYYRISLIQGIWKPKHRIKQTRNSHRYREQMVTRRERHQGDEWNGWRKLVQTSNYKINNKDEMHSGSSVQFSHSVVSNSLQPHELQHPRPPCPSPIPGVYSNSCPSSWWCHPTISSSVIHFSSCPRYFPASGSFQMSQLFASGGQSIGVSASTSVLPMNTQDWSPLGWTGWISLQSKGLSSFKPISSLSSRGSLFLLHFLP